MEMKSMDPDSSPCDCSKMDGHLIELTPMLYYEKPGLNVAEPRKPTKAPLQMVSPAGTVYLGLPLQSENSAGQPRGRNSREVALISFPERAEADEWLVRRLILNFVLLSVLNLVVTCYMFFNPEIDRTKVQETTGDSYPTPLSVIPSHRREVEVLYFAFTVVIICFGGIAALLRVQIGLWLYVLVLMLSMVLGVPSLPYFVYSARFVLDVIQMYMAWVLLRKLSLVWTPMRAEGG